MGYRHDLKGMTTQQRAIINHKDENERIRKEENERMRKKESDSRNFLYEGCEFKITKEGDLYYARCDEMVTYDEDLNNLKTIKIPQSYHSNRNFKLPEEKK